MIEIVLGVAILTAIVMTLAAIVLGARARLVPQGEIEILVNGERRYAAAAGAKLLDALADAGLYLASACGGKGTCGQCRVRVPAGGGALLPAETTLISRREAAADVRLACQVAIREPIEVQVPEQVFGVRRWRCKLRSSRNVGTFIRELVFDLPPGETMEFRAGGYIQVGCPPYSASFADFDIEPQFRAEWDRLDLWRYRSEVDTPTSRAYSMANYPGEPGVIMLNVRIALPPPGAPADTPPGVISSYLFSLRPGDEVDVSGPYGEFFARDTDNEMVFVGGGAGMAPLRSHILDQLLRLNTNRKLSYWYGARNLQELFYRDEFDALAARHANFRWTVALSEPKRDDDWSGPVGFIHSVLYEQYLAEHPAPEECEYYLCGPPVMLAAVRKMLDDLGVPDEHVLFDDFGI